MKKFRSEKYRKIKKLIIKASVLALSATVCIMSLIFTSAQKGDSEDSQTTSTEQGAFNFLVMGVDNSARLADVIMLVSLGTKSNTMTIAQIPRDTYAEYTDSAYRKMNGAISSLGGSRAVADFLEQAMGISIDHYITVDLDGLGRVVDILGGIEVNIPEDMIYSDSYQNLEIELKAGKKLLNGEEAKQFIRYRSGYLRGDIGRLDAQKLFLAALGEKMIGKSPMDLIRPVSVLISCSESDLTLYDCLFYISKACELRASNIFFMTLPGCDVRTENGSWYYILNRSENEKIARKYFSGGVPTFDPMRLFTGEYSLEFNKIYDATSGYQPMIYAADSINKSGIDIPGTKN